MTALRCKRKNTCTCCHQHQALVEDRSSVRHTECSGHSTGRGCTHLLSALCVLSSHFMQIIYGLNTRCGHGHMMCILSLHCRLPAGVYAITRFAFTLCTVVEAVDNVKCCLDTDSTVLLRGLLVLGAPCDDAICLRILQGWRFHLLRFCYGYCIYGL